MLSVKPFAAIFGQQGRVDVNNLFRESFDEVFGQLPKETSQHNQVNAKVLQFLDESLAVEVLFGDHSHRDIQFLGSLDGVCVWVVANHVLDFDSPVL